MKTKKNPFVGVIGYYTLAAICFLISVWAADEKENWIALILAALFFLFCYLSIKATVNIIRKEELKIKQFWEESL